MNRSNAFGSGGSFFSFSLNSGLGITLMTLPEPTLAALSAWTDVRGAYAGPLFLALGPRQHRAAGLSTKGAARIVQRFRMTVESGGGFR